jgi:hypothetical protein
MPSMSVWTLGIDAWVIQDGNYKDFVLGQRCNFAVEAYPHAVERRGSAGKPQAHQLEYGHYEFSGASLNFLGHGGWVIDFGLVCYGQAPLPEGLDAGDVLAGVVAFYLPHPAVYEQRFVDEAPSQIYSWRVERIRLATTPWVEVAPGSVGRRRDETKIGYVDVEATDAWIDDDGSANYLLDCRLLGERGAIWLRWNRLRQEARQRLRQARAWRQRPGYVTFPPTDEASREIKPPDEP